MVIYKLIIFIGTPKIILYIKIIFTANLITTLHKWYKILLYHSLSSRLTTYYTFYLIRLGKRMLKCEQLDQTTVAIILHLVALSTAPKVDYTVNFKFHNYILSKFYPTKITHI